MQFNINHHVLIRELPNGRKQFDAHYKAIGLDADVYREMHRMPDGRLRFQMWELMFIYGPACIMGPPPPFETTIEIEDD